MKELIVEFARNSEYNYIFKSSSFQYFSILSERYIPTAYAKVDPLTVILWNFKK